MVLLKVNDKEALTILCSIPNLGSVKIRALIHRFGSASEALNATTQELAEIPGFGPKILSEWNRAEHITKCQRNQELVHRFKAKVIAYDEPAYPQDLLQLPDYPLLLYVQGDLEPENKGSLAIVGTRQATLYGREMAHRLGRDLAAAGYTIISGLARGIDTAAHAGALETGRTIAVLGSGLACLYPAENVKLADAIKKQGALISEFAMATPPDRPHFPQRNRIVSGLSIGLILIEAPVRSGAMLTAERALSQGKPVFALPGRGDQETFRGNHQLIKDGKARLIETAEDIMNHFGDAVTTQPRGSNMTVTGLGEEERDLLHKLPDQELTIEEIRQRTAIPIAKLNVLLMSLVLKKAIKEYPGKIYKKRH